MRKPKVVSLFSGAGGLDIGFKKAGFHTVFATDVWILHAIHLKLIIWQTKLFVMM